MPSEPHRKSGIPDVQTDHITRKMYDLLYAPLSAAQKLDLYWPADGDGPFPVIISVHGGAFRGGDKRDEQLQPMLASLERGYAVASLALSLVTMPAFVFSTRYFHVLLIRIVMGIANAFFAPVSMPLMADSIPRELRGRVSLPL